MNRPSIRWYITVCRGPSSITARSPVKLAHLEGNMLRQFPPSVCGLTVNITGLSGVEVQTTRSNLWDRKTVLTYKR
jgi:hypothetical protein